MNLRMVRSGFVIWLGATLALRFGGQHLLRPGDWKGTLILFAVTLPLIAWLVRRLCAQAGLPESEWLRGATALLLPTLLLDPFSSAFFPGGVSEYVSAGGGCFWRLDALVLRGRVNWGELKTAETRMMMQAINLKIYLRMELAMDLR